MSDRSSGSAPASDAIDTTAESDSVPEDDTTFEEGRYLYCAVASDGPNAGTEEPVPTDELTGDDADSGFPTGIEGEPVHIISIENHDIGVLVHPCESLYDTDEITRLRKWLLEHQQVIDAAGERFGTPIPFRFDTILIGNDERVREWVADSVGTLSQYLDAFAGCWEYRIEVTADESQLETELEATDDRLADLAARIEGASSGTGFLLEKQHEQRLTELKRARRAERSTGLEERLADLAREVHSLGRNQSSPLADEEANTDSESEPNVHTQARLAVLADAEHEDAIGDVLDTVAAEAGVTVRFTGPWPPYTFAPEIDGGDR